MAGILVLPVGLVCVPWQGETPDERRFLTFPARPIRTLILNTSGTKRSGASQGRMTPHPCPAAPAAASVAKVLGQQAIVLVHTRTVSILEYYTLVH